MNANHDAVRTYGPRRGYKLTVTLLAGVLLAVQAPVLARAADVPPPDPVATTSLLVKMVSGLSDSDQQAVVARDGGVESSVIAPLRLHVVDVDSSQLADVQQRYASDPQVQRVEVEKTREAQAIPSDTDYGQQWALPQIGWDQAYGTVVPSGSATIAVLDTGVDGNQPDLAGHLVPGFSAFPDSSPTVDPNGHGTAMATIAAASTDNATGIAGVAYAGVQVMPVQVLDADGLGQDGDIIAGVVAAADAGADVILMSFSSQSYSPDLQDAINYAWGMGAVLVAATGNDALATPSYPAGDAKVVGVSATDGADTLWSGSNYGADVFIGAPGVDILAGAVGGGTTSITGTSASAAIVAGAAALLRANDSSASNGVIVGRLARNADTAGTADQTGNGRVNLNRALTDISTDAVVPVGAAPSGAGGPFVGPYVAAATNLTSISVGSQSGILNYGTAASATYLVTVVGSGNGSSTIGVAALPSGATFSPLNKTCNASGGGCNFTLTINTSASTPSGTFTFTVTMTGDGSGAPTSSGTLTIGKRTVTGSFTASNRVYDGTTAATIATRALSGVVGTDDVTLTGGTATFVNKNVGTGKTVNGTGFSITGANAGNYTLASSSLSTTANITQRALVVSATGVNKVYDGTTSATVSLSDNRVSGDVLTVSSTSASFADKNVGTGKTVSVSGISIAGTDAGNYTFNATATTTANITLKSVTGSFTASNRVYDGTTAATIATRALSGVVGTDDVTLTGGTATFVNKNVGTGKTVNGTGFSITGANAGNYTLASSSLSTTANITQRALVVSATGVNKVYDGTTSATVSLSDNRVSGDVLTVSSTSASFADKNVGTGKTVSVSGISIAGTDAGNYTFNATATTTANITAKAVTVTADASQGKVYGNVDPASFTYTVTAGGLTGSDTFSGSLTRAAGQNVGLYAIGQGTLSAGSNYTLTYVGADFSISARPITVTAATNTKVYDATTSAAAVPTITTGTLASGDTAGFFETYDNKNVGTAKTLTPAGSVVDGNSGNNYDVTFVNNTTGVISARAITVTAATNSKGYDGSTSAAAVPAITSGALQGSDTGSFVEVYSTKNVGTGKTLIPSGSISDGNSGNNYALTFVNNTTGVITAKAITVSFTASDKVYDGTVSASVASTSLSGIVGSDVVTLSGGSASFADKNVGAAKTVTFSGYSLSGADAGDYSINNPTASTTADITARALTVSAAGVNKVYDGTTTAAVDLSDDRVSGDVLTTSYTAAAFNNKNVGAGKSVSVSGISISGTDAGNYTFNTTASTTADITARILTVTAAGVNKVYDGDATATVTLADDRVVGDVFTASYGAAAFDSKNVGTSKFVSVTGISISGTDAGNYTFNTTASTTANITARALTVSAAGVNKVYDGTTTAAVDLSDDRVTGDVFTDSYTGALFADKNVGAGKSVSVSGISISGTDAGNYTFNTTASTTADITARILTVSAAGVNRVYDGTTTATVNLSDDRISGDDVTAAYGAAAFADKNVGTAKFVSVTGISISGTDAGNYTFNTTASTTANITARALVVSAGGVNKGYDGDTTATVVLSDDRVYGDVLTTSYSGAVFADKNVAANKLVSVSGISISGTDAGNYTFNTTASATADITARALTVTATGVNKVYDGTTTATVTLSDDRVAGDVFTDSYVAAAFNNKSVGTAKSVSVTGISISGTDAGNYTFNTTASATADITARILTVSAAGVNKVYDGTATATVNLSDDRVGGDVFTDSYTGASFNNKNVGTAKLVSVTGISISGVDAGNYTFNSTTSTTANITARALTVSAAGVNKVYDGNATATVNLSDDRVGGDVFTDGYTGALFADKNVGAAKPVGVTGISISGVDAGNYTFNTTASTTADITARVLSVSAAGVNKVYDGTTVATVSLSDDRVSGDVLTTAYTAAAFNNKNVGTAKPVSVTGISISGTDAGNYTANTTASTTADITAGSITVSFTASDKVYDGTTTAPVATTVLAGVAVDDSVALSGGSASFADKNVGTAKTVTLSGYILLGDDAGNYTFNTTASTTADITARILTVSATGVNKVYDGDATATVTLADDRVVGDVFTASYGAAAFDSKNVGAGKSVSVTGISISGTDAGNYTFNTTASTTANITARALTVSATGINKIYDGDTTATVTLSDDRVSGDVFTDSYGAAAFDSKNVGAGKSVSVTGISISGTDAGNYTFNTTASTTADITARALTVTATGVNRIYDGTTVATVSLSDDRVAGDVFTDSYGAAAFANKNVGTGKLVSVTGISISGTDAGNYTFNTTASTTADITARALTVSAAGVNKVYDGTTTAAVDLSDDRVSGDVLTTSYTAAAFNNKNVSAGKSVSVSGISISGTDAGNYTFNTTASTTADITARILTVTAAGVNKVYDGTTTATVTLGDDRISGDDVTPTYGNAAFADKNVGTSKFVGVTGISIAGTDAGNYTFNTTASTTANITARALTVSAAGVNKVYDGTTTATVTLSDDRVTGDVFTDSYTGALFADKNVGAGKSVSVSGISISGTDAGNYTFNTTASTTADITARILTVSAAGVNRVYDGTTTATVNLSDDRISGDDVTAAYGAAAFADKNVGTAKFVSVTGISISGTDAGNYTFNTTASTTANITARALVVSAGGVNKGYDGDTTATVVLSDDRVYGDVLTTSYSGAVFADKNVAANKLVSVSGISISGTDAGNYTFNTTASATADITARALTVTATGVNKVYDGTTTATVTLSDDRVAGDVFTDSYVAAAFNNKSVGTAKSVSVTGISISGTDAGNYTFNTTASATADITARILTVSAAGVNKVYDGTATATVNLSDDRVGGDVFTDSYTGASFNNKNVGTAKLVSVTGISISGVDAGNYTFNSTTSTTANITARALTVSAAGVNKVYDGNATATVNLSDDRVGGDVFTDGYTGALFADKNVGAAKPVGVTGISISGVDAGNYTFNTTASTTADITARVLSVSAAGVNKVYDGTTVATVSLSDDRVSGDVLTTAYTAAAFNNKNVGTAKPVSVTGISISGTDAGNYTANTTASTTADITARVLSVSAAGVNKVYDGTATATVNLSDDRVTGDLFTDNYVAASFSNKNVGTAKLVSVTGISVSGTDAGNYTFNSTASTTADITARALTVSATGVNKVYDGNTTATVTLADNRVVGDVFTDSYVAAAFDSKNVGAGKSVGVTGISISGTDAGNYTFNTTASTTANITARGLTVSATGVNKVYDGTTTASVTLSDDRVSGDSLTTSYTAAAFNNKNVGTGKSVSVTGISISGTDAGNYTANTTASTTANLTARALTVSAAGVNKVYDGTTVATVSLSDNRVAGDVFTDSYGAAAFNNKNVGTGKSVGVTGISISGTDAGNYTFNTTASTTANITARALTVSAAGVNKVYDGNTTATVMLADNRVVGDVFTDSYVAAAFADKNVGTAKPVGVTGISISGTDAGNYTINTTASASADITPAALTITADDKTMISGGSAPAFTVTPSGFATGETMSNLAGTLTFVVRDATNTTTVTVNSTTPAGTYLIVPSGLTSTNYNITFVNGNLKVSQRIEGFYSPVDMTVSATVLWNSVKGGSTVPLKFRVYSGANQITSTAGITLRQTTVTCAGGIVLADDIPTATGGTALRYDTSGQQFIFNWSVPSKPNVCYLIGVQVSDGSVLTNAYFKTK